MANVWEKQKQTSLAKLKKRQSSREGGHQKKKKRTIVLGKTIATSEKGGTHGGGGSWETIKTINGCKNETDTKKKKAQIGGPTSKIKVGGPKKREIYYEGARKKGERGWMGPETNEEGRKVYGRGNEWQSQNRRENDREKKGSWRQTALRGDSLLVLRLEKKNEKTKSYYPLNS